MATVQKVCFYGQVWLFRASILFQKLNLRLTHSSLIKKLIYMREKLLIVNISG